jgi:hypothetical protein
MPNRLPPCLVCGPRKRHIPERCPAQLSRLKDRVPEGNQNDLNGIPQAIDTLKKAIVVLEALKQ